MLAIGLRPSVAIAVPPSAPHSLSELPQVRWTESETELLELLRASLLDTQRGDHRQTPARGTDRHPYAARLGHLGYRHRRPPRRAHLPGTPTEHIAALTEALGVADLIELVPGPGGRPALRRKTCCIGFTLPQPKVCSGCCIKASQRP